MMQPLCLTVAFIGAAILAVKFLRESLYDIQVSRLSAGQGCGIILGAIGALSFLLFGTIAIVLLFGGGS